MPQGILKNSDQLMYLAARQSANRSNFTVPPVDMGHTDLLGGGSVGGTSDFIRFVSARTFCIHD